MLRTISLWRYAVALALVACLIALHAPASAQAGEGSITATVYGCAPGVGADGASPDTCEVLTEGFGLNLAGTEGDVPVQTLGQAAFDGRSYTWTGLPVPTTYLVFPARPPDSPYTSVVVVGDGLEYDVNGSALAPLTPETPSIVLAVYSLAPAGGRGPVSTEPTAPEPRPVVSQLAQPPATQPVAESLPNTGSGAVADGGAPWAMLLVAAALTLGVVGMCRQLRRA